MTIDTVALGYPKLSALLGSKEMQDVCVVRVLSGTEPVLCRPWGLCTD